VLVVLLHVGALSLAYLLLHYFHERAWYWHALAVAGALWIGLMRMPEDFSTPSVEILYSLAFAALLLWGVAGPVFGMVRNQGREKHA
jgi:hypothetical protein